MDIYENLVIGNFLFGLGAEMSRRHLGRAMPDTFIGNLQQAPLDESYADVMVRNPGIFRLIEFKREARRKDKKEVAKRLLLETGMRSSTSTPDHFDRLAKTSSSPWQ